jgi:hypothetical protein
VAVKERVFFRTSGSLVTWDTFTPFNKNARKELDEVDDFCSFTEAINVAFELESNWSVTTPTQVKLIEPRFPIKGRRVDVCGNSIVDLNKVKSESILKYFEERNAGGVVYPNW